MPFLTHIRAATLDDVEQIAEANRAMAWETEKKKLDVDVVKKGVSALLLDAAKGRYLIAEDPSAEGVSPILGQLMLTREWSDWRCKWFWWIQSVYIWPKARRHGVYAALYAEVEKQAEAAKNVCEIRLYVDRENQGAQNTYEALGMRRSDYLFYEAGVET